MGTCRILMCMNIKKIGAQQVNPAAISRYFPGDSRAVLLIHGFTGTPFDMVYLGTQLNSQGFTVSIPRLPGHGTSYRDFRQSSGEQWLRRVIDEYMELEQRHSEVYIAGLSMGGLLTIILSGMFNPKKIALAAPAITTYNRLLPIAPMVGKFLHRYPITYTKENTDPNIRKLEPEYWQWQQVWGAGHLYSLQVQAKKYLPRITAPTLTIVSNKDEMVPPDAAKIISRKIGCEVHKVAEIENSPHIIVNDNERELVARLICTWFLTDEVL